MFPSPYSNIVILPNISQTAQFFKSIFIFLEIQKIWFPLYPNVCTFIAQQIILSSLQKGSQWAICFIVDALLVILLLFLWGWMHRVVV